MKFIDFKKIFIETFWPEKCVNCDNIGNYVCGKCLNNFKLRDNQTCPKCKTSSNSGKFCNDLCSNTFQFDQLVVCSEYMNGSLIQSLIASYKYKYCEELVFILSKFLITVAHKYVEGLDDYIVVPVPIDRKRLKMRGFNHCLNLAKVFIELYCHSPPVYDCLERTANMHAQMGLKRSERLSNLKGIIRLKKIPIENMDILSESKFLPNSLSGKKVLLIDDVATTCSTLNECSKVLKANGVEYVCALVLARGK